MKKEQTHKDSKEFEKKREGENRETDVENYVKETWGGKK